MKGYPIPRINWYRNNLPLQKIKRIRVDDDNTLFITKTSTIDTGSYSCRYIHEMTKKESPGPNSKCNLTVKKMLRTGCSEGRIVSTLEIAEIFYTYRDFDFCIYISYFNRFGLSCSL